MHGGLMGNTGAMRAIAPAKAIEVMVMRIEDAVPDHIGSHDAASASSMPRLTILEIAPLVQPTPRTRISMPAITDPAAPSAVATPFPSPATDLVHRPVPQRWWRRITSTLRGWYKRVLWARRRRAALRG